MPRHVETQQRKWCAPHPPSRKRNACSSITLPSTRVFAPVLSRVKPAKGLSPGDSQLLVFPAQAEAVRSVMGLGYENGHETATDVLELDPERAGVRLRLTPPSDTAACRTDIGAHGWTTVEISSMAGDWEARKLRAQGGSPPWSIPRCTGCVGRSQDSVGLGSSLR